MEPSGGRPRCLTLGMRLCRVFPAVARSAITQQSHLSRCLMSISALVFYQLHARHFAARPSIEGHWPRLRSAGEIRIGVGCRFRSRRLPQQLTTLAGGRLEIGQGAFLNDGVSICAARSVTIGRRVKLADWVYISDTDFHPVFPGSEVVVNPISIGANVWIGARAIVLPGSTIGDHSVIAAGSIVRGEIPAKSVAAGAPARVVKSFEVEDSWVRP